MAWQCHWTEIWVISGGLGSQNSFSTQGWVIKAVCASALGAFGDFAAVTLISVPSWITLVVPSGQLSIPHPSQWCKNLSIICLWNRVKFNKGQQNNFYGKNEIMSFSIKTKLDSVWSFTSQLNGIIAFWVPVVLPTLHGLNTWNSRWFEGPGSFIMCIWRCL